MTADKSARDVTFTPAGLGSRTVRNAQVPTRGFELTEADLVPEKDVHHQPEAQASNSTRNRSKRYARCHRPTIRETIHMTVAAIPTFHAAQVR